jgi:hypothetical protein
MIRELVLVAADFSAVPSAGNGAPPPAALPAGFSVEVLAAGADVARFAGGPVDPDGAAQRLAEGDRCIVVRDNDFHLAAQMWCATVPRLIDWIGAEVAPRAGHALLYNAWVAPAARGRGLQWALAARACADVAESGLAGICAGVERREYAPFARKYATLGLAVIVPYASLWSLRLLGRTWSWQTPPPVALHGALANARAAFTRACGVAACA